MNAVTKELQPRHHRLRFEMPKKRTLVVRIHEDVAMLADRLAPTYGQSTPDFLSELLRPILESKKAEVAKLIVEFPLNGGETHEKKPARKK